VTSDYLNANYRKNRCTIKYRLQYNTIQYKTYNAPYVTKMLFVGAGMTRD